MRQVFFGASISIVSLFAWPLITQSEANLLAAQELQSKSYSYPLLSLAKCGYDTIHLQEELIFINTFLSESLCNYFYG